MLATGVVAGYVWLAAGVVLSSSVQVLLLL
jgi:hypothetical protein